MTEKQEFARQLEGQIDVWQGQIRDYQERLGQAAGEARAGMEKLTAEARISTERAIEIMHDNIEKAGQLLAKTQEAQEAAWKDIQTAQIRAFAQLQQGWADALSRFR